jgi:hypothetical protein
MRTSKRYGFIVACAGAFPSTALPQAGPEQVEQPRMFGNVKGGASPLGIRTNRLRIVDYYTVPWEDVRAGTPAPVMIASRDPSTGLEEVFAWHLVAEHQGRPRFEVVSVADVFAAVVRRLVECPA